MGHIVRLVDGHLVYDGLLSSQEKATVDEILETLQKEIPILKKIYFKNMVKMYYTNTILGLFLGELLERYNISVTDRRRFWDEIKTLATKENRKRNEGAKSVTRSFYQQCYILAQQEVEAVKKAELASMARYFRSSGE